ncbi:MAG: glycerate 2-kinase [Solirubrobacteraceae bacterium]|jgi:glycerate kinase|nr:glycerate 2-kinase [Solirubrobacteraceae bacterium]MEA2334732.1 glycerate 2-kinase [Solirubrobacteraceae bacterium]
MLPRTLLVASRAFGEQLSAQRVATAVARGLADGGWQVDLCPIEAPARATGPASGVGELLGALNFDARMRSARALIVCEYRLQEDTLTGSVAFEIATRARQSGVPAYAVTAHDGLDSFDARVLDLQAIVQATGTRSLRTAGRRLAGLV